jgi:hypothetical protein
MTDTKLIILVIVLILLFGGSFYLAEESVKSHLSYAEYNFRNARGDRLYNHSKRLRVAKDDQGHRKQAKVDDRLLSSADDLQ